MKWFFPSWNGDFRLEPTEDGKHTTLIVQEPTAHEAQLLHDFLASAKRGWIVKGDLKRDEGPYRTNANNSILIKAPLEKVGPMLVTAVKPKDRTITAVSFKDGHIEVAESVSEKALTALAERAADPKGKAKAAVSVARPTPSCPQCQPGAIEPATEVLLSFLDDKEHEDWANHRAIMVEGGLSGHRYILAHRHSKLARKFGRIGYDVDSRAVMHFFDWSVPPEEEILAAKLILEHREPWLRNEATFFDSGERYKNPFGDSLDGTETSSLMVGIGAGLSAAAGIPIQ